jgi:hypothetical protein
VGGLGISWRSGLVFYGVLGGNSVGSGDHV